MLTAILFFASSASAEIETGPVIEEPVDGIVQDPEHQSRLDCRNAEADDFTWLDEAHSYLNASFCAPARWFDSFFSTDRIDQEVRPGSNARWQHDFTLMEDGSLEYTTNIRASFKVPKASAKLRLVFEGNEQESIEEIIPRDAESKQTQVGLLYELRRKKRSNLNLKLSLKPSLTLRYRYSLPVTESFTFRFTQQVYRNEGHFGEDSQFDLIETFNPGLILRQTTRFTRIEDVAGTEWGLGLVLFQRLSDVSALSYESSYNGLTEPETYADNARLGIRYRRNFYRKWLFYEVVPQVNWPRELFTDQRERVESILFRLEINFVNR